ncbi:alpha/beta fold hydrolase [Rathayibacter soli]|uniref:alpha/beta fold hydrolase n=1 Tax=Rathayibacter soli TaxID=3144168 RepID=UPI0027E565F0|nr:alpha/beta fold hydrolase [Glaciibacter superstes]
MANFQFTLPSGRRLGVTALGDPLARHVVVFCHAAPGSSVFDPDPVATAGRNVHLLAFDRPGYGSSDPLPPGKWPTVTGAADDISEFLHSAEGAAQTLGNSQLDSLGAVGWSAGGRVALALAAKHPDVFKRVAAIATPAPNDEVAWIPPQQAAASAQLATLRAEDAIERLMAMFAAQPREATPLPGADSAVSLEQLGISAADAGVLARPGARDRLEKMVRDAFRQGAIGVVTDILSYTARPWGFDLSAVRAETLLVYGAADPLITPAHAQWYRDHLEHASVDIEPNVGHLVVMPAWDRVLAHLAPDSKAA